MRVNGAVSDSTFAGAGGINYLSTVFKRLMFQNVNNSSGGDVGVFLAQQIVITPVTYALLVAIVRFSESSAVAVPITSQQRILVY
jgi:hypothetical protein